MLIRELNAHLTRLETVRNPLEILYPKAISLLNRAFLWIVFAVMQQKDKSQTIQWLKSRKEVDASPKFRSLHFPNCFAQIYRVQYGVTKSMELTWWWPKNSGTYFGYVGD